MKPFEIQSGVAWIGALHPDLRVFDIIMKTKNGTTYNSYMVQGENIAVIDTVKDKFTDLYLKNLSERLDFSKIDYIVVQHNEPDHSGSLTALMDRAPQATILCAKPAVKYVQNIINRDATIQAVKEGDEIDLGGKTLRFISSPFLHWPDTMMTYLNEDKILFSCDVFANHFCDSRMIDREITRDAWPDFEYYFKMIFRPFKKHVQKALDKVRELDVNIIAPSHGPILTENIERYIKAYDTWSEPLPENDPKKALIYYVTAHGNTKQMAEAIATGLSDAGISVDTFDVTEIDPASHLDRIERCDLLFVGSPTINNDAVQPIWGLLSSLATLDIKGKVAASFGSIGWSGEAVKFMDQRLSQLKFKVPKEGVTAVLTPSPQELEACETFGHELASVL
jgi:flavorubredoxin